MVTKERLIEAIVTGELFFARLPNGEFIARYTRHGLVQEVSDRGLSPLPVQGSDLCWHIQAADDTPAP